MHVLQIWDENTVDGWIQDLSEILNRSWSLRMVSCLLDGDCSQLQLFNGFVNSTLPLFLQETHSSLLILLLIISRSGKGDWVQRALGGTESKWKVEKIIKKNDKGFGLKIRILKKKKKICLLINLFDFVNPTYMIKSGILNQFITTTTIKKKSKDRSDLHSALIEMKWVSRLIYDPSNRDLNQFGVKTDFLHHETLKAKLSITSDS